MLWKRISKPVREEQAEIESGKQRIRTWVGGGNMGSLKDWDALLGSFKGSSVRSGHGKKCGDAINLVITRWVKVLRILRLTSPLSDQ